MTLTRQWNQHKHQYLALSPYNKDHYFVAFRNRTVQYNFTGAPPEWMMQMHQVFAQWQTEIAQVQGFPQQLHPSNDALPPHQGALSPQLLPNSPASYPSSLASPPFSPHSPQVYASYVPQPMAVEMPGTIPVATVPAGGLLQLPPAPVQRPTSIHEVRFD